MAAMTASGFSSGMACPLSTQICQDPGLRRAMSVLKTGKARAVRFSTLAAICRELDCQPGDILEYVAGEEPEDAETG
jgi:DNA-binding Xre family transcriptional regulator